MKNKTVKTKIYITLKDQEQRLALEKVADNYYVTVSGLLRALCILLLQDKIKFGETEILKIIKNSK